MQFKVLFMETKNNSLNTLKDIKNMMEQSSRFISLSGLSGITAGLCALGGAFWARYTILKYSANTKAFLIEGTTNSTSGQMPLKYQLLIIAAVTFIAAFVLAFLTTYIRSKKQNIPIWGYTAKRLMSNVMVPLTAGGIFVYRMLDLGMAGMVAPACLIFYGITLFCGSKYTLKEIKYLGYSEIILGIINLWYIGYGLYFWAIGFGVLHIIYGAYMWLKYERRS